MTSADDARLDAATAWSRILETLDSGGWAVSMLVVGPDAPGRRRLLLRRADGVEEAIGTLGDPRLDGAADAVGRGRLASARGSEPAGELEILSSEDGTTPEVELFLEVRGPSRELVIVGAGHIAQPMCRVGALLGFGVIVLDDRPGFATVERFPEAGRVVRADFSDPFADVPLHAGSHVLLVTRGHRYDYDCLVRILALDVEPAYVGMIGSRRRVRATFQQLLDDGIARERLDGIHAPVGLDIGAETPQEIAVAVGAELIRSYRGGTGAPLKDVERVAERFFNEVPKL